MMMFLKELFRKKNSGIYADEAIMPAQNSFSEEQAQILKMFGMSVKCANQAKDTLYSAEHIVEILKDLIVSDVLTDRQILEFDSYVLSTKYILHPEITPGKADISELPGIFCGNSHYMSVLKTHNREHSPEKARLKALLEKGNNDYAAIQEAGKEVSASFLRIVSGQDNKKYCNQVWIKYINLIADYMNRVPDGLLEYVTTDNYRALFNLLKNLLKGAEKYSLNHIYNTRDMALEICRYILENINAIDAPALLLMGNVHQRRKEFRQAQSAFKKVINSESRANGITALADCYEEEIKCLMRKLQHNECDFATKRRIKEVNGELRRLYESSIEDLRIKIDLSRDMDKTAMLDYVTVSCRFARWAKRNGDFKKSMDVLNSLPEDASEYYRVLLEKGLLYQCQENNYCSNPYHDLSCALDYLKQAEELAVMECGKADKKLIKSILIPMANTLFSMGQYENARETCYRVIDIDPREKNALKLLDRIEEQWSQTA